MLYILEQVKTKKETKCQWENIKMLREPHTFHLQEALEGILDANLTEHVDWSEKIFYSYTDSCLGTFVLWGCKCS